MLEEVLVQADETVRLTTEEISWMRLASAVFARSTRPRQLPTTFSRRLPESSTSTRVVALPVCPDQRRLQAPATITTTGQARAGRLRRLVLPLPLGGLSNENDPAAV